MLGNALFFRMLRSTSRHEWAKAIAKEIKSNRMKVRAITCCAYIYTDAAQCCMCL